MALKCAFQSYFVGFETRPYRSVGHETLQTCPRRLRFEQKERGEVALKPLMSSGGPSVFHRVNRRSALQMILVGASAAMLPPGKATADADYVTYKGPNSLGFSFSYPSGWSVKKKPIKTHLSELIVTSDKESSVTAGLVVDSVKIDALDKFGSPEAVGQKVVSMETKKDSVKSAEVLDAKSITSDGLTYYILDYIVDSSRGAKRYLAKATITGGQLYVFTAQSKIDAYEGDTRDTLTKMLDSFSVTKQYI